MPIAGADSAVDYALFDEDQRMTRSAASAASIVVVATLATPSAADLREATNVAFDRYVRVTEVRMGSEVAGTLPFLWIDRLPEPRRADAYATVRRGEIVVSRLETRDGGKPIEVPDGMCHHWVGTVFAPRAHIEQVVSLMQSYDRYPEIYRPAVRRSHIVSRSGDRFSVELQLFMKKVISVVLNTNNDVQYASAGAKRMHVRSYSTRIAEVSAAGTPQEREKPVGHDNGFLWRFNNYCSFEERAEGAYIQCESVSLSRKIPIGLGWLVGPFVTSIPRESLEFTLGTIRTTVTKDADRTAPAAGGHVDHSRGS
jgi:hypothetical protein